MSMEHVDASLLPELRDVCVIGEHGSNERLYLAETLRAPSYFQRLRANLRALFGPKNADPEITIYPLERSIREANRHLGPADVLHHLRFEIGNRAGLAIWPCSVAICRAAPFGEMPPCLVDMSHEAVMILLAMRLPDLGEKKELPS